MTDRAAIEVYQAFMAGYVQRLNAATFNVTIGGVRIGSAKYSRLAQINLHSRIITFSRFAVENVPERGRRYLVLHELAHVKEANHNQKFWQHVERFEPNYKQISRELEVAFKRNVRDEQQKLKSLKLESPFADPSRVPGAGLFNYKMEKISKAGEDYGHGYIEDMEDSEDSEGTIIQQEPTIISGTEEIEEEGFECMEKDFSLWNEKEPTGIIHGGSEVIQLTLSFD
jgi:hypothetical protein